MVGQVCLAAGEAKNTYGTGNFLLLNTGTEICRSDERAADHRLLPVRRRARASTPWRARSRSPARRSSGCVTSSGSSATPSEIEALAREVDDVGGAYFVPAFSGLFAPVLALRTPAGRSSGCPASTPRAHLARAALEAICYQSVDVVQAMEADSGRRAGRAQGRRRGHRERPVHADPGRHARRRRQPAGGGRDHGARGGVRRRPGRGVLGLTGRAAGQLARGPAVDPPDHRRAAGRGSRRLAEGRPADAGLGRRVEEQHDDNRQRPRGPDGPRPRPEPGPGAGAGDRGGGHQLLPLPGVRRQEPGRRGRGGRDAAGARCGPDERRGGDRRGREGRGADALQRRAGR